MASISIEYFTTNQHKPTRTATRYVQKVRKRTEGTRFVWFVV